jgi:hypothetical protein
VFACLSVLANTQTLTILKEENNMKLKMLLLLTTLLIFAETAFGGWVFVESSEGDTQTRYIQDNRMKIDAADHIIIFDLNKNLISFANPKEKTYWSGSPQEFAAQAGNLIRNIDKTLERQLANIPPPQREAFKRTLLQQVRKQVSETPPRVEVKTADQSGKIAGYDAEKYEILFNGLPRQDQWIAKGIDIRKSFDIKRFGEMMRVFHSGSGPGSDDASLASPQVIALLNKGWPLRVVDYDEDGYPETDEVVKVENKTLPESVFTLPKQYRKMSMTNIFN